MTISIQQLLDGKGYMVYSITPDATVYEAIKLMNDVNVGALLVMENDNVAGIISERDYTRKIVLQNRSSRETRVRDIMTEEVLYVTPDQTIEDSMLLMSEKKIRHVPVLKNGKAVGVLSIKDVLNKIIEEKEYIICQLESYITGNG